MIRSIVAVFIVLLAAAGGAYWYFVHLPAQMAAQAPAGAPGRGGPPGGFAMPVEAAPVRVGTSRREVLAVGTIRSNESVVIKPEVAGRIVQINFTEGQKTKKGQMLIQLDSSMERAELVQAQAALVLAKANYERADELVKRNAGTGRALDEARAALRTGEASVLLSQARLDKFTLTAPFDGMLGLRKVSVGDYVTGGAEIVNLEMVDPLKVDFRVPEIFLATLRTGQKAAITVDAMPDRKFEAEVFAIDPLVDQAGRSVVIRARIPNPDDSLRPGLFARVVLTIEERQNAVFVAEQSLVPVGDQHFLFKVVDKDGAKVVAWTKGKLGERRKGEVEIIEGLAAGDVVVTAGLLKIRDGMPVQILPSGPPAVAEGAARG
jgi:membrane fusion protein (multidrug efflux system)